MVNYEAGHSRNHTEMGDTKYHIQVATHGCCDVIHTQKHIKHDENVISFVAISPKPKYQAN